MKRIALAALVALLAGCAGHGSSAPPAGPISVHGGVRVPQSNGGPGTTSLTYDDTWAPTGQCSPGVLTVNNTYAPAHNLSFAAGQGPPLVLSNCNFSTPQYVQVTLGTPSYGTPYIRQTDYTVTVDAPAAAQVTATWTALGTTLPGTPGLSGTVTFTIGPSASSSVLWKTGSGTTTGQFATPAPGVPPNGDGQCGGPVITGSNASFTAQRNTTQPYDYDGNHFTSGASSCFRNQMNPLDSTTGSNFMFTMGTQYTFTFQTVVTLNGNTVYQYLPGGRLAVDLPAMVWQTHSNGQRPSGHGYGPCDVLEIGNTYVDSVNGIHQYDPVTNGGQATWTFHTCSDSSNWSAGTYHSPDTLYDGEVDSWQIDITAQLAGQSGRSVVVQRNGAVVYNAASGVCDSDASDGCWWNFGPYTYYYETTEEPPGWNSAGITVKVNDMTLTTPNGGGGPLSKKRGVMGIPRKPSRN